MSASRVPTLRHRWPSVSPAAQPSDLKDFELLLNEAAQKAPLGELIDIMDVGFTCAYLATSLAKRITGGPAFRSEGLRASAERSGAKSAPWRAHRYHGCRLHVCLPCDIAGQAYHRRHSLPI